MSVISSRHAELGGNQGILGRPIAEERELPHSAARYQRFENGVLLWTPGDGTQILPSPPGGYRWVDEFALVAQILRERQDAWIGIPTSADSSGNNLLHFQTFADVGPTPTNSLEMHEDGTVFVAYTAPLSPTWYDMYFAADMDLWLTTILRPWAQDFRTFQTLKNENVDVAKWRDPLADPDGGGAFPSWRGSAPRWFERQVIDEEVIVSDIPNPTTPSVVGSGKYCFWDTTGPFNNPIIGGGPPEWASLAPANAFNSPFVNLTWVPKRLAGIVTNSFLSGGDYTGDHADRPGDYWLGVRAPLVLQNCTGEEFFGKGTTRGALCNDLDLHIIPDPEHRHFLAPVDDMHLSSSEPKRGKGNFNDELKGNFEAEIEQWLVPVGYRPEPGDRIDVQGRWIVDCGHEDWHTEFHPIEVIMSSYLQCDYPPEVSQEISGVLVQRTDDGTWNIPPICFRWGELTDGKPATVTKLLVTGAWQGGTFEQGNMIELDVWPPARPSVSARLRSAHDEAVAEGLRIVQAIPVPLGNPNHLHVLVASSDRADHLREGSLGDVDYELDRRLATSYLLWWEEP
jgi:LGFP repeat